MLARGLITRDELEQGRLREPARPLPRVLARDAVAATMARGAPTERPIATAPAFAVGDCVRARNLHPASHTRLPRYCRGKRGTIVAVHGAHVFPDAHVTGAEDPQWVYTVRFDAHELWGRDTTASSVHVDCFEPYLEPSQ